MCCVIGGYGTHIPYIILKAPEIIWVDVNDAVVREFWVLSELPSMESNDKSQRLIKPLEERGIARQISQWNGSKPIVLEGSPKHFEFLDSDALLTIADVTNFFADATSKSASDFSHMNLGWKLAWDRYQREGNPAAVNMRIAMQQIVESDPWMRVPLSSDEEILAAADDAIGDDW